MCMCACYKSSQGELALQQKASVREIIKPNAPHHRLPLVDVTLVDMLQQRRVVQVRCRTEGAGERDAIDGNTGRRKKGGRKEGDITTIKKRKKN